MTKLSKVTENMRESIIQMKRQGVRIVDIADFCGISTYLVSVVLAREKRIPVEGYIRPVSFEFVNFYREGGNT